LFLENVVVATLHPFRAKALLVSQLFPKAIFGTVDACRRLSQKHSALVPTNTIFSDC